MKTRWYEKKEEKHWVEAPCVRAATNGGGQK